MSFARVYSVPLVGTVLAMDGTTWDLFTGPPATDSVIVVRDIRVSVESAFGDVTDPTAIACLTIQGSAFSLPFTPLVRVASDPTVFPQLSGFECRIVLAPFEILRLRTIGAGTTNCGVQISGYKLAPVP